jgi:hypothetical protein
MLRILVALLLLANGLYLAWAQGWLGTPPRQAEREPQRLAAQVAPGSVTVLPAPVASAAVQAARAAVLACIETDPLREPDLGAAEARLAEALVSPDDVQRLAATRPGRDAAGTVLRLPQAPPDLTRRLAAAGFKPCSAAR